MKRTLQYLKILLTAKLFLGLSVISFPVLVKAQQLPLFSLQNENAFVQNPAIVGSGQQARVFATYRHQWITLNQAPKTQTASLQLPFHKKNIGIGIHILNDQTGPGIWQIGKVILIVYNRIISLIQN